MNEAEQAVELARQWVQAAATTPASRQARLLSRLVADPAGLDFAIDFVDRVVRPDDTAIAAAALARLSRRPAPFLPLPLRTVLRAGRLAPLLPSVSVGIARRALRALVGHLVVDARPRPLTRAIARLRADGNRLNINLLGEAVLGDAEAAARRDGTARLLARDDVDYVSIKVSAVVSQLSMWAFDDMVERIVERLTPLFELAGPGKFINLDMEEYRDLDLTLAVFRRLLDQPQFAQQPAGIVLQAYLPDSAAALSTLLEWARRRVDAGGAPIKVRIVKGANLAMERVDAELHGWPSAPFATKLETDANYKRLLDIAMRPEMTRAVRLGIAGHNLFDIAYAHLLGRRRHVPAEHVDFEMLLGMATEQADQVRATVGPLLLYTPVVDPADFTVAIAYLVRRLEENASAENFMSAIFHLDRGPVFEQQADRFRAACALAGEPATGPRRTQNRLTEDPQPPATFGNEPDTDPALPAGRAWGRDVLARPGQPAPAQMTSRRSVDKALATASAAAAAWKERADRADVLRRVAASLARHRGDLVAVMATEAGKTIDQGDPEVSEAIDFAAYYAGRIADLDIPGVTFEPAAVTLVTPPWNFPVAIPAGSVLAALAAGSAVLLKPAGQARRCAWVLAEALWEAGVPREVLQMVDVPEDSLGRHLVTHPSVDRVILTGSFETARLFKSWEPGLALLAETSGKNALIVAPSADVDAAAADLVRSAFGHAGQKCSAASLAILVGSVGRSARFERQLLDAARTLRVGPSTDPLSTMGPIIEPAGEKLRAGLTTLGPGECWLLQPRQLSETLWTPGIRTGVRPGSEFHRTEYFGPVLGIMRARTLDEAIEWQNAVDYGLTAGLHTLDVADVATWVDAVQAGNLYVNRVTTGAIVGRQPFGGWKRSAVGPTAKAGGPNYLMNLGRWVPEKPPRANGRDAGVPEANLPEAKVPLVRSLLAAARGLDDAEWLAAAAASDEAAWLAEYGRTREIGGLRSERNLLRYRPAEVQVRLGKFGRWTDLVRLVCAGVRAGATVRLSVADEPAAGLLAVLRQAGQVRVEDTSTFTRRLAKHASARVRIAGPVQEAREVTAALGTDPAITVFTDPVTGSGRVELRVFLQEQAISLTNHRYGEVDDWTAAVLPAD